MPVFVPDRPVRSRQASQLVENPFDPGRYRFRLVVVGRDGSESEPAELTVIVLRRGTTGPTRPDRVVIPTDILRRPIEPIRPRRPGRPP